MCDVCVCVCVFYLFDIYIQYLFDQVDQVAFVVRCIHTRVKLWYLRERRGYSSFEIKKTKYALLLRNYYYRSIISERERQREKDGDIRFHMLVPFFLTEARDEFRGRSAPKKINLLKDIFELTTEERERETDRGRVR